MQLTNRDKGELVKQDKKKAFLVFGPEGTGTRLFTRILITAGCEGEGGHRQKLDSQAPEADMIVWRRSFPHDNLWPSITDMTNKLRDAGYEVNAFVTSRDWHAIMESRGERHITSGGSKAVYEHLQKSSPYIFRGLKKAKVPFVCISYEAIILQGEAYVKTMLACYKLELLEPMEEITNQNSKYYEA